MRRWPPCACKRRFQGERRRRRPWRLGVDSSLRLVASRHSPRCSLPVTSRATRRATLTATSSRRPLLSLPCCDLPCREPTPSVAVRARVATRRREQWASTPPAKMASTRDAIRSLLLTRCARLAGTSFNAPRCPITVSWTARQRGPFCAPTINPTRLGRSRLRAAAVDSFSRGPIVRSRFRGGIRSLSFASRCARAIRCGPEHQPR